MSVLSDREIKDLCTSTISPLLDPFVEGVSSKGILSYGLSHCGYDLRLGNEIWVSKNTHYTVIDPKRMKEEGYADSIYDKLIVGAYYDIAPGGYVLARSFEYIRMPRWLSARCIGKSTYARCHIGINTTLIEPEWEGYLVIEIGNHGPLPVRLHVGEGIAQLIFDLINAPIEKSYKDKGGKYQNQLGIVPGIVK